MPTLKIYISILLVVLSVGMVSIAVLAGEEPAVQAYEELTAEMQAMASQARSAKSQEEVLGVFKEIENKLRAFREKYPGTPEANDAAFQLGTLSASAGGLTQDPDYHLAAIRYLSEYIAGATPATERRNVATAHYYLAESYKNANKFDEAKSEYELLIRDFGDVDQRMTEFARNGLKDMDVQRQLAVGSEPIAFSVTSTSGEKLSPAQYKGKVLLLDFWATWCRPCLAEMPNVKRVYEKYKSEGFEIVGISLDRSRASLDKYIEAQGISWPQYFDGKYWQNDLAMRYGVRSIPTTYLIDRHGKIRYKSLRGKQLENAISQLIAEEI